MASRNAGVDAADVAPSESPAMRPRSDQEPRRNQDGRAHVGHREVTSGLTPRPSTFDIHFSIQLFTATLALARVHPEIRLHARVPGIVVEPPQETHSSSLIDLRQARNGSASGPTGWRSCHVSLVAISSILSATRAGAPGSSARS